MSPLLLNRRRGAGGGLSRIARRLAQGLAVLTWLGAVATPLAAQEDTEDSSANLPPTTITSIGQFWTYRHFKPTERQALDLEFVVTYFDPYWNMLWGAHGDGFFLPTAVGKPLPIKLGQRVRITGSVVPEKGLSADDLKVAVLAESAWPAPMPTAGRLHKPDIFEARRVEIEGVICGQAEADATHIKYLLLAEGRLVNARLLLQPGEPVPQLGATRVRVRGVYVGTKDPSGAIQRIDLWVGRSADIETVGPLATDPRFAQPIVPIAQLRESARDAWVHVAGKVVDHDPGHTLIIRDETGQITLPTPQPARLVAGDDIDAVGRLTGRAPNWTLREPVFRTDAIRLSSTAATRKLRLAGQVLELGRDTLTSNLPVELIGVVAWSHPQASFFYLHDSSGGVCVRFGAGTPAPTMGDAVVVRGTTRPGDYAPEVKLDELSYAGQLSLPSPRTVTLEQALTGAEEGHAVEIRGYLRDVQSADGWTRLDVTTATGEFSAYAAPHPEFATLKGAVVRLAGICAAESNPRHELTGVRLWVATPESVFVEVPPAPDPFSAPARTIKSLRQFAARDVIDRRVRIVGAVTRQAPGRSLYVQDGDAGLLVLSRDTAPAQPGERIEVVGFPGREGARVVLRAASWRPAPAGSTARAEPVELPEFTENQPELDGRLVRLRGTLTAATPQGSDMRLTLHAQSVSFEAQLPGPASQTRPRPGNGPGPASHALPRPGSVVELTGVYAVQFDEARRPRRFTLLLRSGADLAVISEPSWWTPGRFAIVAGIFALCSAVGISWVVVLRRRVARQTDQIRAQLANEARLQAELERASRLESLGVLAGGIAHDFNNLLTAIIGNLGLIALESDVMRQVGLSVREAQRAAKRASDVTQQLLTFAKGGDPVRQNVSLAEVVQEAATFALHGAKVGSEFSCPPDLPAAHVDAGQISRVVHNLVINAVQAMPNGGLVRIALAATDVAADQIAALAPGRYVQLSVTDNGSGIPPDILPRIFEPYFSTKGSSSGLGLATVHSIVKKHQGHVAVESRLGHGTTFSLWLPVARETATPPAPPPAPPAPNRGARVLLMDDEEIIRNIAGAFLKRFGHEATLVADGAAAVRTYAEARQSGHPFDVVILDLTVPGGMGGREALTQLRDIDPAVRAVASSGYSSDPVLANFRAHGFRAIMPKPYDLKTFAAMLDEVRKP